MSKNTVLPWMSCSNNQLTSLDVSNTALESLLCNGNQLTSLDVSTNTELTRLECGYNQLTSLDVSNTALTWMSCSNNNMDAAALNALFETLPNRTTSLAPGFIRYIYNIGTSSCDPTKHTVRGWVTD